MTMRKVWAALVLALATGAVAAQEQAAEPVAPPASEPVRVVDADFTVGSALKAKIGLGIGSVVVRGEDVDRIYARLQIYCDKKPKRQAKCADHARDVSLRGESNGDRLDIAVKGVSEATLRRMRLRLEVRVPSRLALEVRVVDGQARIDDVLASIDVAVSKGTVDVSLPGSEVAELTLEASGNALVEWGEERVSARGTLSDKLNWQRPGGIVRLKAKASIGDVRVVMD
jgi:hypothetical protein